MMSVIRRVLVCVLAVGLLQGADHALAGKSSGSKIIVQGVVQDGANGYLKQAKACLDFNGNAACDSGEPYMLTSSDGKFVLQSYDPAAAQMPVIVEVPITVPTYKDSRSVPAPFTMAAPGGYSSVVNPLTTLVHARMVAKGVTAADAEAHYKTLLGVSAILGHDYVTQNDAATRGVAGSVAGILAAARGTIADAITPKIRLKMLLAVAEEINLALAAERTLASIVITRGWVFATPIPADAAANPRNVAANPGEVVVHAGLGYHKTMFDSADNNCQNCHNDLYDTWKKSVHAKSWNDQIFQSQYQDYLRMSIARIGVTGAGGLYTEAKFKGAAQVCIRCHAPAAYYSNDYDVQLKVLSTDPLADYTSLRASKELNKSPNFDPNQVGKVVSLSADGKVYQATYHIGNKHNREGISCAFCHSIETVRLKNDVDGDLGQYKLGFNMTAGPIGPVVYPAGSILQYSWNSNTRDMNAFFMLVGPEKYADPGNTPKNAADFDLNKIADGRYTMKSIILGQYTGGPYYGPWVGVSGLHNVRADDTLDRAALVNPNFVSVEATSARDHHFKSQSKALCLSCHQRSAGAQNPESNGIAGTQTDDHFMELCTTWSVASTGPQANYKAKPDSPQCTNCHMERIANKVALHKWNSPTELYTAEDGMQDRWDPADPDSIAARGYMASHAYVGSDSINKLKSAVAATLSATVEGSAIKVTTSLLNKTGHEFPAAHPMRRALTRVVVTDATGKRISYVDATGSSSHEDIVNTIATIDGETVYPGREKVGVKYNPDRVIDIPFMEADLNGGAVSNHKFDRTLVNWMDGSFNVVVNPAPVQKTDGSWTIQGQVYINKIVTSTDTSNFTRIYGHETGKKDPADSTRFMVRPGFDSSLVRDNRLLTNERETYQINFDATQVDAWPVTVAYRVYYMKKGANGSFPTAADGFLDAAANQANSLGIKEVYKTSVQVSAPLL